MATSSRPRAPATIADGAACRNVPVLGLQPAPKGYSTMGRGRKRRRQAQPIRGRGDRPVPIIGLREDLHLQPIVRRLQQVEEDFINYTDHQRIERVWGAISTELTDVGVPVPTLEIGNFV